MILNFDKNDPNLFYIEESTDVELRQLKYSLNVKISNYYFHPLVKKKLWDGSISFINRYNRIPVGLWYELKNIAEENNFKIQIRNFKSLFDLDIDKKEFEDWVNDFFKDTDFTIRDYQIDSAYKILRMKRSVSEIATSAGKTLIIFIVFTYLKLFKNFKKMIIVVPNLSLIEQTLEKFEEYSNKTKVKFEIKTLFGGKKVTSDKKDVYIGTYQTLVKLSDSFYSDVDCVCVDESHFAKTKSLSEILKKCHNTKFRFGVSGTSKITTKTKTAESFTIQSSLGPLCNTIKSKYLADRGFVTPVTVKILELDYLPISVREKLKYIKENTNYDGSKLLNVEKKLIRESEVRFEFLIDLFKKATKNTLIMFSDIKDSYGKNIFDRLNQELDSRYRIYYIDGSISKDKRDFVRKEVSKSKKINIIVASYGVFSTGVDIPNIHYIFLAESYKSEVIIKQTAGRGMRKHSDKKDLVIFDIVDDFRIKGYDNYIVKHAEERRKIYLEEKYVFSIKKFDLKKSNKIF